MRRSRAFLLAAWAASSAVAACAPPSPQVSTTPAPTPRVISGVRDLVTAMRERYEGWYRTLTFVQTSTWYGPNGQPTRSETWYEAAAMPGRLRIDIGDPRVGTGALYRADSVYQFQEGRLTAGRPGRNILMLLGFDIYFLEPDRSLRMLAEEGFDTTRFHRATADGREYFVIGASADDSVTKQAWIEADRLLFWRLRDRAASAGAPVTEIRFQKYVQHGGGWVAEEVDFLRAGQRFFFETYADVRINVPLDERLFDPGSFTTAPHWFRR
jgi:hypothetical protein